eukprot:gnl/MRDRNA2_/MRDRNA2_87854_c0_seq1.p1 gnl/MRDRNA2_/MRDRNA2_87854_c0~~gnl/MRDRNA2_/MRDRNA2_87854_c0_seq1.p1  ORF type:complete len:574 (+),score=103.35 gnl/MRDRNA2_/MRDRNA2_87854_c0_seq1:76-1797(+)
MNPKRARKVHVALLVPWDSLLSVRKEVHQIKHLLMKQRAPRRYTAKHAKKRERGQKVEVDPDVPCADSSTTEAQADAEKNAGEQQFQCPGNSDEEMSVQQHDSHGSSNDEAQTATEQNDVAQHVVEAIPTQYGMIHFGPSNTPADRTLSAPAKASGLGGFMSFINATDSSVDSATEQLDVDGADTAYCQSNADEDGTPPLNELEGLDNSKLCQNGDENGLDPASMPILMPTPHDPFRKDAQPAAGMNAALGSAFNTQGQSNDSHMVEHDNSEPDQSKLMAESQTPSDATSNHKSHNSINQWIEKQVLEPPQTRQTQHAPSFIGSTANWLAEVHGRAPPSPPRYVLPGNTPSGWPDCSGMFCWPPMPPTLAHPPVHIYNSYPTNTYDNSSLGNTTYNCSSNGGSKCHECQPRPRNQNCTVNKCRKVEKQELTSTTVRLANIPNNMKRWHVKQALDELNNGMFWDKYDFLYLAFDWTRGDNLGYAFINFLDLEYAKQFQEMIEGQKLDPTKTNSKKTCRVGNADAQGLDACLKKFKNVSGVSSHPVNQKRKSQRPIQWVRNKWRLLNGESDIEDS